MDHEKNTDKMAGVQKRYLIRTLAVTILLAVMVGTLAWLNYSKRLQTITKVEMPILMLKGKDSQDAATIEIGDIDVTQGTEKTCVFGVKATKDVSYIIQLAHTTNIPFTYTIYPASSTYSEGDLSADGYYYKLSNKLEGGYLNKDTATNLANSEQHVRTYGQYKTEYVQKNAEPLYWQSNSTEITASSIHYYVLRITWGDGISNDKETDMVYLTVGTATDSPDNSAGGTT